jgi:hypothetical protein
VSAPSTQRQGTECLPWTTTRPTALPPIAPDDATTTGADPTNPTPTIPAPHNPLESSEQRDDRLVLATRELTEATNRLEKMTALSVIVAIIATLVAITVALY